MWEVELDGSFPERALRYVVLAGGDDLGYGIPSADGTTVRTVTSDPAVLTERLTVEYGGEPIEELAASTESTPLGGAPPTGPYDVRKTRFNLGDEVFRPTDFRRKIELAGNVHYPTPLADGPFPLVLFLHGNHATCYRRNDVRFAWPCRDGWRPLPNYAGYDYLASDLASYGVVVASVSGNGVNVVGSRIRDTGMRQRGELLNKHLNLWRRWSTSGGPPFADRFIGAIDMTRIGTMGHSRGGEGVVWHKIVDEERTNPYGIDAVLALAPVDFTRVKINNVPFAVVLPTCDGDVSDLQGVHFFDDSRYAVPGDPTPKHTLTAFGANHNFFNTVWTPSSRYPGGVDDGRWGSCPVRLDAGPQRRAGRAYIGKFFRRYLLEDDSLNRVWTGARAPWTVGEARAWVTYLAPDTPDRRKDVNRYTRPGSLLTNDLGGAVTPRRLSFYDWCSNRKMDPCSSTAYGGDDIHWPGLAQARIRWRNPAGRLIFDIPDAHADVSSYKAFQFRTRVDAYASPNEGIRIQDLAVELIDGTGARAQVTAREVGNMPLVNPVETRFSTPIMLNQLRFPLARFTGIDLTDISVVRLLFSEKATGAINVSDVAFTSPPE